MEQRRLLLAFALSILVLLLYQELFLRRFQKPRPLPGSVTQTTEPAAAPERPAEPTGAASGLAAPADEATLVTIETDTLRARITPLGARLMSLELKQYRRTVDPQSPPLDLVQPAPVLPLTVALPEGSSDARVAYRPDRPSLSLHGAERGEVVFVGEAPNGLTVEKHYGFDGAGYVFQLTVAASGAAPPAVMGVVLTPVHPDGSGGRLGHEVAIGLAANHLTEKSVADLQKKPGELTDAAWAGFAAQYFLLAVIPVRAPAHAIMTVADAFPVVRVEEPVVDGRSEFRVFAGPKERETLAGVGYQLDRALDFGWFWFVAVPLLHALRLLHSITGNYGVAIIVLTALVKLATTPLTQTTFRNMREMQKIQPQMAKLRERFKNDQAALQKEMMELYRRHRVNPFSGCLPMLLQLPIFVGLYNTLSHAIELRHEPFFLWINDLSAPDRLMVAGIGIPVLTLFMGASMFVQQWMSPQQGDPTQQRMMLLMPLAFTFMFMNFPSGLVLYWLVNNVLTIAQQYFMLRSGK